MVDCLTVPLQVPAQAQIVLEGYLEPGERLPEGPFGDHTGFYTPVEPFPVLHIEAMTTRATRSTTRSSRRKPPQEDHGLGKATERIFLPLLKLLIPDIVDYDLPAAGVFHNCVIVSIRKRYPKHAQKVMNAIWGAHLLSLSKLIVVVDEDCDVHDYAEVAFRAFGNVDYAHDLLLTSGPGRPPRPRVLPAVLGRQGRRGRDPQAADRGLHPGLAGGDDDVAGGRSRWWTSAGRSTGSRDRRRGRRPGKVRAFLRLVAIEHSVFALPFAYLSALTAMDARRRAGPLGRPAADHRGDGRRADLRDGGEPDHRPARSTRRTRVPPNRELVTGAVSVRTAWTGAAVALVRAARRRGRCSTRSAWCCRRSR